MNAAAFLTDGRKSIRSFLKGLPSLRELARSRQRTFSTAHCIRPSTAVTGEAIEMTVLAWDRYERLVRDFDGQLVCECFDPDATIPDIAESIRSLECTIEIIEFSFRSDARWYLVQIRRKAPDEPMNERTTRSIRVIDNDRERRSIIGNVSNRAVAMHLLHRR